MLDLQAFSLVADDGSVVVIVSISMANALEFWLLRGNDPPRSIADAEADLVLIDNRASQLLRSSSSPADHSDPASATRHAAHCPDSPEAGLGTDDTARSR